MFQGKRKTLRNSFTDQRAEFSCGPGPAWSALRNDKRSRRITRTPRKKVIMPLKFGKLTKKFFMNLNGGFMVSNCGRSPGKSVFEENVQVGADRQAQWRRIVAVRANGRTCQVFRSRAEAALFQAAIGGAMTACHPPSIQRMVNGKRSPSVKSLAPPGGPNCKPDRGRAS